MKTKETLNLNPEQVARMRELHRQLLEASTSELLKDVALAGVPETPGEATVFGLAPAAGGLITLTLVGTSFSTVLSGAAIGAGVAYLINSVSKAHPSYKELGRRGIEATLERFRNKKEAGKEQQQASVLQVLDNSIKNMEKEQAKEGR